MPIRKMRPVDENDHVGLETFYVHILALCTEARALNLFHHVANPLVTAMFVVRFPLSKIRDWDSYRNGEGLNYPNEFRAMEQFCRDRLPGCADWLTGKRHVPPLICNSSTSKTQIRIKVKGIFTGKKGMGEILSMTGKGSFIGLTALRQMFPPPVSKSALQKMRPLVQN